MNTGPKNPNIEEVFKLYFEYDGNMHAMLEDKRCFTKDYHNLYDFCQRNGFKERLEKIQEKAREMTNEQLASALVIKRKEIIALVRGIVVKFAEKLGKMGKQQDGTQGEAIDLNVADLERAYRIFKTELGEASEISRHEFSGMLSGENIYDYFLRKAEERKGES